MQCTKSLAIVVQGVPAQRHTPDPSFHFSLRAMDIDLLNPDLKAEKTKHKLKRMIQSPNSFFMDVKCPGCLQITTVYSHAQTMVLCGNCNVMLCQPTGGLARLTEGCSFRRKVE